MRGDDEDQTSQLANLRARERDAWAQRQESLLRLHASPPLRINSDLWLKWERADAAWLDVLEIQLDLLLELNHSEVNDPR